jgi:two-component system chemotaxis sensor kinase CheA
MSWKEQTLGAIKGLWGWIARADATDKAVIVGIGSSLESTFNKVPPDEELAELAQNMLLRLQEIYQDQVDDPSAALATVGKCVELSQNFLEGKADESAIAQAKALLGGEAPAPANAPAPGQDAPPSAPTETTQVAEPTPQAGATQAGEALASTAPPPAQAGNWPDVNAMLSRLVSAAPADKEGLQALHDELMGHAAAESMPVPLAERFGAAASALQMVLQDLAPDAGETLALAGRDLEAAANLCSELIGEQPPVSTPAPPVQTPLTPDVQAVQEGVAPAPVGDGASPAPADAPTDAGPEAAQAIEPPKAEEAQPGDVAPAEQPGDVEPAAEREAQPEAQPEPAAESQPEPAAESQPEPAADSGPDPAAAPASDGSPAPVSAEIEPATFDTPATLPEECDPELMKDFIVECLDHLTNAEAGLLDLETNADETETINVIFRAFHTIKGSSGFLGLDRIQKTAHLAENMLDRARDGQIRILGGYADLALKSCDALRTMIEGLEGLSEGDPLAVPEGLGELLGVLENPEAAGVSDEQVVEPVRLGDLLVGGGVDRDVVEQAAAEPSDKPLGERLMESKAVKPEQVAKALRTQKSMAGQGQQASGGAKGEQSIRVGTDRLDSLINMVGELVIAQSMVAQDPTVASDEAGRLSRNVSHAGKIIRELQDLTMSLRMVPLKATFQKMARLVRDVSRKAGKQIQFVTEGEDTEIDRTMVESLGDPLIHMMRNACDHGVENAEDRVAAGKEPMGTVVLRAYHSAGNVVIEITDDGKGIDRNKVLAKAVERGLVEKSKAKEMSDNDAFMLVFQPGFSTAEKITDVSGRGVGMDVVRKNIESLRGRIEISSKVGEGSTFTIRLPLTMAITDAMLCSVGEQRYLLPTVSIEQSFRPEAGTVSTVTGRGQTVLLRGELLPIFRLKDLFGIAGGIDNPQDGLLIIIEGEGKRCALMVDELLGQQQVVIKSLGSVLGSIPGVSGGAILGDGRVGLILDAGGILKVAEQSDGGPIETAA